MSKLTDSLEAALAEEEKQVNALIDAQAKTGAPVGSAGWTQYQRKINELGTSCARLKRDIAELKAP